MRNLNRQTNEHILCKNIVSCCVWKTGPFACDVKPATTEQHLLIKTRSTEYRKIKQKGHNKFQQQKLSIYLSMAT